MKNNNVEQLKKLTTDFGAYIVNLSARLNKQPGIDFDILAELFVSGTAIGSYIYEATSANKHKPDSKVPANPAGEIKKVLTEINAEIANTKEYAKQLYGLKSISVTEHTEILSRLQQIESALIE